MPLWDFECDGCRSRSTHYFSRLGDAEASRTACPGEDCKGTVRKACVTRGGPEYQPTIERWIELERGHLSTYRPPPSLHTKSGAGIRRWPGGD